MYPDPSRKVFGHKSLSYLENDMARYICQENILPVLIPDVSQPYLDKILDELDGFVLQGGSDIAPETYHSEVIGPWKGDAYRDQYELGILSYAIQHSRPVFAICRGFQLLNVFCGGSLYQDIETQLPTSLNHRSAEKYDTIHHRIVFEQNNFLDHMYRDEKDPNVNSVHHQAIDRLGNQLEVFARSEDGLIEAIGFTGAPEGKVFGVQWHPEFSNTLRDTVIPAEPLFRHFIEQVQRNS